MKYLVTVLLIGAIAAGLYWACLKESRDSVKEVFVGAIVAVDPYYGAKNR